MAIAPHGHFIADPVLKKVLVYYKEQNVYLSNDLHGERPKNEFDALTDTGQYLWKVPVSAAELGASLSCMDSLWIEYDGQNVRGAPCALPNGLR